MWIPTASLYFAYLFSDAAIGIELPGIKSQLLVEMASIQLLGLQQIRFKITFGLKLFG